MPSAVKALRSNELRKAFFIGIEPPERAEKSHATPMLRAEDFWRIGSFARETLQ
jgi:hypothetical protein